MIAGWWGISGDLVVCQKSSHHQDYSIFGLGDPELYLDLSLLVGREASQNITGLITDQCPLNPNGAPCFD